MRRALSTTLTFAIVTLLSAACAKESAPPTQSTTPASTEQEPEPVPEPAAPTATMLVTHEVRDFDTWKKAFDQHQDARKAAGVVSHLVTRWIDKPTMVRVFLVGTDAAKLQQFAASDDLKAAMKEAGVIDQPEVRFGELVATNPAQDPYPAGSFTIFREFVISDFDKWKAAYDLLAAERAQASTMGDLIVKRENTVALQVVNTEVKKARPFYQKDTFAETLNAKGAGITDNRDNIAAHNVEYRVYE